MVDQDSIQEKLALLRAEHRDLDDAIAALSQRPVPDLIQLQRLKKKKLQIKDQMSKLETELLPDIIA